MSVRAVVTDIEGTTSSLSFVHDVLFPYAARELPAFVREGSEHPQVAALLDDVRGASGEFDAPLERIVEILLQWIAEDRKAGPLKTLQGMVWRQGYENGDFTGHVYPDAADRLRRWHLRGIRLFVYSSGSVEAQKLLFGHSDLGDLRPLFEGHFDTGIGHKNDRASYAAIQAAVGLPASAILFLSDVVAELDAAAAAGMRTTQLVRSDGLPTGDHPTAKSFDDVIIG